MRGYVIAADGRRRRRRREEEAVEVTFAEVYAAADAGQGRRRVRQVQGLPQARGRRQRDRPALYGIVDRPMAAVAGFGYSDALAAPAGRHLDAGRTRRLAREPEGLRAGQQDDLHRSCKKIEDRANLIAYLATIGG